MKRKGMRCKIDKGGERAIEMRGEHITCDLLLESVSRSIQPATHTSQQTALPLFNKQALRPMTLSKGSEHICLRLRLRISSPTRISIIQLTNKHIDVPCRANILSCISLKWEGEGRRWGGHDKIHCG